MSRKPTVVCAILAMVVPAVASLGGERPPVPKVEILQPAANQELVGEVLVHVKITPPQGVAMPRRVRAGLGGTPWVELDTTDKPGEWKGQLDSTLVPNGQQTLMAVSSNKRARAATPLVINNPWRVFFADLHSHTSYSDGELFPDNAHAYARDVAKLDVFVLSDHLESIDDQEWLDTREVAFDFNEDGKYVVIPGLEWTKQWGHLNLYDPKTRVWPNDPTAFYRAAAAAGIVTKFNHPGDGTKSHAGLTYSEIGDKTVQLMEVRQEIEEQAFIRALNNGWHIAPEGSDDTHSANWGNCGRWTGILAPGLTKRTVLDALANRRIYSTHDRNCELYFKVNGAVMGTIVDTPTTQVEVEVALEDDDAGDTIAKIELFEDGVVVETQELKATRHVWRTRRSPEPGKHYYFAKVTQSDGHRIWSAPVWITAVNKKQTPASSSRG